MSDLMNEISSGAAIELRRENEALAEFKAAAVAFRDAELALRAAHERYKAALDKLNRTVAPVPEAK